MEWIETKVSIYFGACEQAAELISMIFYDLGLKGVVIEDPELMPDESWGKDAVGPPETCSVTGYFSGKTHWKTKIAKLEHELRALEKQLRIQCRVNYTRRDEENWAESWKAFFWPEKITRRITVKPTWRSYEPLSGEVVVEIDPGMAFGTGTHPTTAMCIRLIEKYLKKGSSFLDVGMGSGILMVVAAKLGATLLCGIDNDEIATEIAERNLLLNQVPRQQFTLHTGNLLNGIHARYDLIAANILSREIRMLLAHVPRHLSDRGMLICSGIIEKNCERILSKIKTQEMTVVEILKQDGWVAIVSGMM